MLRFEIKQYNEIGSWLNGIIEKNGLDVIIKKPRLRYIDNFYNWFSFSYLLINKLDPTDITYLYIQYNQQIKTLSLKFIAYGTNENELYRDNVNGTEIEEIIVNMYNQFKDNIDLSIVVDENPFATVTGKKIIGQTSGF